MINADTGDNSNVGIDNIDCIEASTKANLKNNHIQRALREQPKSGQGAHLKIGQTDFSASLFYRSKSRTQLRITDFFSIDPYALVVTQQVRRTVDTNAKPLSSDQTGQ